MDQKEIRRICKSLGSSSQAAKILGVDPRTVRRWTSGESAPRGLSRRTLENIKGKISVDA